VRDRLKEVLGGVLELPASEIPDDASADTLSGWDSLRHLELMLALELEYGVHIPTEDMLELRSLEAIEAFVAANGG